MKCVVKKGSPAMVRVPNCINIGTGIQISGGGGRGGDIDSQTQGPAIL
jgi:hypothetical protein